MKKRLNIMEKERKKQRYNIPEEYCGKAFIYRFKLNYADIDMRKWFEKNGKATRRGSL